MLFRPSLGEKDMRKIEQGMIHAILNKKNFSCSNTKVEVAGDVMDVFLFGHHIAEITDQTVRINNQGYTTSTTKSRLNSILRKFCEGRILYQKDFVWYISGEPILNNSCEYPSNIWNSFPNVVLLKSFE
jgi:hypothetical protein